MKRILLLPLFLWAGIAFAQQSPSFKISDQVFNAGGRPADGMTMSSASYRVSLDAIGDLASMGLESASYRMDASFTACYPPPEEIMDLGFVDADTLTWSPDPSGGNYHLYRDALVSLGASAYGACSQANLTDETAIDTDPVAPGVGYFYLVTANNRLNEEGTMGTNSTGAQRLNAAPCP